MAHYRISSMYKASSTSSSSYVPNAISMRCIVLRYLIILHMVILRLRSVVLRLCVVILLWNRIILWWCLIKLRWNFTWHHFSLHPLCVWRPFPHQIHCYAVFVIVPYWLAKCAVCILWYCLVFSHHRKMTWIMHVHLAKFTPGSSFRQWVWHPCFHILYKFWTFVHMVPLCSTFGTPNNFSLVLALILIELEGNIIQILLQLLYSWIYLVVLILLHLQGFL